MNFYDLFHFIFICSRTRGCLYFDGMPIKIPYSARSNNIAETDLALHRTIYTLLLPSRRRIQEEERPIHWAKGIGFLVFPEKQQLSSFRAMQVTLPFPLLSIWCPNLTVMMQGKREMILIRSKPDRQWN